MLEVVSFLKGKNTFLVVGCAFGWLSLGGWGGGGTIFLSGANSCGEDTILYNIS